MAAYVAIIYRYMFIWSIASYVHTFCNQYIYMLLVHNMQTLQYNRLINKIPLSGFATG